ncbi:HdeD family acid-resistance protein [Rhodobacteraceae bacterium CCMM004]|nr:HdeD family acid-resistance protein [Rhodobacteraceae bacterium CCMM004]
MEAWMAEVTGEPQGSPPKLNSRWMLAIGGLYLLGGIVALLQPFAATLTVGLVVAVAFIGSGAIQTWMALRNEDGTSGTRLTGAALGGLLVVFGVLLLVNPLAGLVSLTLMVASFFLALGVLRLWVSFQMPAGRNRWMVLTAGGLSVTLAIVIFLTLPKASFTVLGLFFGIEMLFAGAIAVAMALAGRSGRG